MEADFAAHQDRIDGVKIAADQFYQSGHFDAENIKQKQVGRNHHYAKFSNDLRPILLISGNVD